MGLYSKAKAERDAQIAEANERERLAEERIKNAKGENN